jgi:hypothetical protein
MSIEYTDRSATPVTSTGLRSWGGASNGTRTRDIQDHNLALYQLSYARHPGAAM